MVGLIPPPCSICAKTFEDSGREGRKFHMITHFQEAFRSQMPSSAPPYNCPIFNCPFIAMDAMSWNDHYGDVHGMIELLERQFIGRENGLGAPNSARNVAQSKMGAYAKPNLTRQNNSLYHYPLDSNPIGPIPYNPYLMAPLTLEKQEPQSFPSLMEDSKFDVGDFKLENVSDNTIGHKNDFYSMGNAMENAANVIEIYVDSIKNNMWPIKCLRCETFMVDFPMFEQHVLQHWLHEKACPLCSASIMGSKQMFERHIGFHGLDIKSPGLNYYQTKTYNKGNKRKPQDQYNWNPVRPSKLSSVHSPMSLSAGTKPLFANGYSESSVDPSTSAGFQPQSNAFHPSQNSFFNVGNYNLNSDSSQKNFVQNESRNIATGFKEGFKEMQNGTNNELHFNTKSQNSLKHVANNSTMLQNDFKDNRRSFELLPEQRSFFANPHKVNSRRRYQSSGSILSQRLENSTDDGFNNIEKKFPAKEFGDKPNNYGVIEHDQYRPMIKTSLQTNYAAITNDFKPLLEDKKENLALDNTTENTEEKVQIGIEITGQKVTTKPECVQDYKSFQCETCFIVIPTKISYDNHIKRVHKQNISQSSQDTNIDDNEEEFLLEEEFEDPEEKKVALKCPTCDFDTFSENSLKQHIAETHFNQTLQSTSSSTFQCTFCSFSAAMQSVLEGHLMAFHESNMLKCQTCPFRSSSDDVLEKHYLENHNLSCKEASDSTRQEQVTTDNPESDLVSQTMQNSVAESNTGLIRNISPQDKYSGEESVGEKVDLEQSSRVNTPEHLPEMKLQNDNQIIQPQNDTLLESLPSTELVSLDIGYQVHSSTRHTRSMEEKKRNMGSEVLVQELLTQTEKLTADIQLEKDKVIRLEQKLEQARASEADLIKEYERKIKEEIDLRIQAELALRRSEETIAKLEKTIEDEKNRRAKVEDDLEYRRKICEEVRNQNKNENILRLKAEKVPVHQNSEIEQNNSIPRDNGNTNNMILQNSSNQSKKQEYHWECADEQKMAIESKDNAKESLQWYEKCEFRCMKCPLEAIIYYDIYRLMEHVSTVHDMSKDEYRGEFEDTFPTLSYHECRICEQGVKHQYSSLDNHFKKKHDISVEEYSEKFDLTSQDESSDDDDDDSKNISDERKQSEASEENRNSAAHTTVNAPPTSVIENRGETKSIKFRDGDKWYNRCVFSCGICPSQYFDVPDLIEHAFTQHNENNDLDLNQYRTKYCNEYKNSFPLMSWYYCKICNAKLKHQYSSITHHLTKKHDSNIEDYGAEYHPLETLVKKEQFYSNTANTILQSSSCSTSKKSNLKPQPPERNENSNARDFKKEAEENFKIYDNKQAWYRKCEFKCALCSNVFYDVSDLIEHVVVVHEWSRDDYCRAYSSTFPMMSKYLCQICDKEVKHQYSSISQHVKRYHNLSIKNYEQRFHPETVGNTIKGVSIGVSTPPSKSEKHTNFNNLYNLDQLDEILRTRFDRKECEKVEMVINNYTDGLEDGWLQAIKGDEDYQPEDLSKMFKLLHTNIINMPHLKIVKEGNNLAGIILAKFFIKKFDYLPSVSYKYIAGKRVMNDASNQQHLQQPCSSQEPQKTVQNDNSQTKGALENTNRINPNDAKDVEKELIKKNRRQNISPQQNEEAESATVIENTNSINPNDPKDVKKESLKKSKRPNIIRQQSKDINIEKTAVATNEAKEIVMRSKCRIDDSERKQAERFLRKIDGKFGCTECENILAKKKADSIHHILTRHCTLKEVSCDFCNQVLKNKISIPAHLRKCNERGGKTSVPKEVGEKNEVEEPMPNINGDDRNDKEESKQVEDMEEEEEHNIKEKRKLRSCKKYSLRNLNSNNRRKYVDGATSNDEQDDAEDSEEDSL